MEINKHCLYRFVDYRVSTGLDEWGDSVGSKAAISLYQYPILKETPKGAWIEESLDRRFVNLTARKQFACKTEKEAAISFVSRKKRQITILKAQLKHAQESLNLGLDMFSKQGLLDE